VADGRKLFIHVGALMDARTPNEMIGVIAHEAGHIAGGHLIRLRQELANAQVLSIAGMLLGGAAAVGASRGGGAGNPGVGVAGAATGAQELVRRSLLRYQRSEEQAADRAALNYLAATGQSPKGMLDVFKRFGENSMFLASRVDPYTISHPLPQDRIANLEDTARKSPHFAKADPPALTARHDLARAKVIGYMEGADSVNRRYPASDTSLAARYARAVSLYRQGRGFDAIRQEDGLIAAQPRNAYFHELKGQILLESGRPREAVASLRQAVSLAPSQGLLKLMLAQAEISTGDPKLLDGAIRTLSNAMQREPNAAEGYRWLGRAYAQRGDIGMAELASAQYFFVLRQWKEAHTQAFRAKEKLKPGSPGWLKADDILNFRPPDK
jgi:predicted Zn-dependent protease